MVTGNGKDARADKWPTDSSYLQLSAAMHAEPERMVHT